MTTQSSPTAAPMTAARSVLARPRQVLTQPWGTFHGWLVLPIVTLVVLGWVLPVFHHPAWIMVLGSLYAMKLGRLMGAVETIEGIQEFTTSLPISRRRLLWTRLIAGLAAVFALATVATLAIAFNWPQAAWGLFVESGFTAPFGPWSSDYDYFYTLAIICPVLTYLITFGAAAGVRSRQSVDLLAMMSLLLVLAGVLGGIAIGYWRWPGVPNSYIAAGILALLAAASVSIGARAFLRKSVVYTEGTRWAGLWIIVVIVLFAALMALWSARANIETAPPMRVDPPAVLHPSPTSVTQE